MGVTATEPHKEGSLPSRSTRVILAWSCEAHLNHLKLRRVASGCSALAAQPQSLCMSKCSGALAAEYQLSVPITEGPPRRDTAQSTRRSKALLRCRLCRRYAFRTGLGLYKPKKPGSQCVDLPLVLLCSLDVLWSTVVFSTFSY